MSAWLGRMLAASASRAVVPLVVAGEVPKMRAGRLRRARIGARGLSMAMADAFLLQLDVATPALAAMLLRAKQLLLARLLIHKPGAIMLQKLEASHHRRA